MDKIVCIYIIKNKLNSKFYIGSTINFYKRKTTHLRALKRGIHHSNYLQRAYNKYGVENFTIDIFQFCDLKEKKELEQYYLDLYAPAYNVSLSAICPMQGRVHSKETLAKFKSRPRRIGPDNHMYGKKWTEDFRKKIIELRINRKFKHSAATRLKMSKTSKRLNRFKDLIPTIEKMKRKIIDSSGVIHSSLSECAKYWNISTQTVCDILKLRHTKTRKGISFKYV